MIVVLEISEVRHLLGAIKRLGRSQAETLGFLPEGAFDEYALKRQILVATDSKADAMHGYLLYRISQDQIVSIAHLCVAPTARGRGVAKEMVERIVHLTRDCRGLALWCRRDFPASKLWPKLGFVAARSRPGRSAQGSELTYWWRDYGNPDLFRASAAENRTETIAALDANVLMDLAAGSNEESQGLMADWIADEITLQVTPELSNEIERRENATERTLLRQYSARFPTAIASRDQFIAAEHAVRTKIPFSANSESDQSDARQVAWAIASGAQVFVTRDERLLSSREEFHSEFHLSVCRPSELIAKIDALQREEGYQPARLAGTLLGLGQEVHVDEDELSASFQNSGAGETKTQFLDVIRRLRARPTSSRCLVVRDTDRRAAGLLGYTMAGSTLRIDVLRAARGPLAKSIERYLLIKAVLLAASAKATLCQFEDHNSADSLQASLDHERFLRHAGKWLKIVGRETLDLAGLGNYLRDVVEHCPQDVRSCVEQFAAQVQDVVQREDIHSLALIEDALWPARIRDLQLPIFVVPIRPVWAQHLFDEELASQQLFGARSDLALNSESIYYRSPLNSGGIKDGVRVLWYVSLDSKFPQSGAIRAESLVNEVVTGTAKELYRRFKRLGVYDWRDVVSISGGNPHGDVMAIRFSRTLLFRQSKSWSHLKPLLERHGVRTTFQSPIEISMEIYKEITDIGL